MADADDELAAAIAMSLQPEEAPRAPSPLAKRRKSDEWECDAELVLAGPGEARRVRLPASVQNHRQLQATTVEHGSSLALIAKATSLLNSEFTEMDPEADWAKWQALGATIYFFVVADEDDPSSPCCVLRTVLDGDFSTAGSDGLACLSQGTRDSSSASCARRVVVDYLMTAETARGRGHAGRLLECAREMSRRSAANLLVLAIEESCPYWMQQGFILDDGPINKRINQFPDVTTQPICRCLRFLGHFLTDCL
jgi:GNAT superfamily N-acetyltransferase